MSAPTNLGQLIIGNLVSPVSSEGEIFLYAVGNALELAWATMEETLTFTVQGSGDDWIVVFGGADFTDAFTGFGTTLYVSPFETATGAVLELLGAIGVGVSDAFQTSMNTAAVQLDVEDEMITGDHILDQIVTPPTTNEVSTMIIDNLGDPFVTPSLDGPKMVINAVSAAIVEAFAVWAASVKLSGMMGGVGVSNV